MGTELEKGELQIFVQLFLLFIYFFSKRTIEARLNQVLFFIISLFENIY